MNRRQVLGRAIGALAGSAAALALGESDSSDDWLPSWTLVRGGLVAKVGTNDNPGAAPWYWQVNGRRADGSRTWSIGEASTLAEAKAKAVKRLLREHADG